MPPIRFKVDFAHDEHSDLSIRKRIAARWLLARDLRWGLQESHPEEEQRLSLVANTAISVSAEGTESLSEFLDIVLGEIGAQLDREQRLEDSHVQGLAAAFAAVDCKACALEASGTKGSPCKGSFGDRANLHGPATCIKPFADIAEDIAALAESAYSGILQGGSPTLTLRLVVQGVIGATITGATTFASDTALARTARVVLGLPVNDFDPAHLSQATYTLLHEVFVHGPEAWAVPGARMPSNDQCALREGFVDAAAIHCFQAHLRSKGVAGPMSKHGIKLLLGVRDAHIKRVNTSTSGEVGARAVHIQRVVNSRMMGRSWFELLEARGIADRAARLAMCLNTLALSPTDKGRLIPLIDRAIRTVDWGSKADLQRGKFSDLLAEMLKAEAASDPAGLRAALERALDEAEY